MGLGKGDAIAAAVKASQVVEGKAIFASSQFDRTASLPVPLSASCAKCFRQGFPIDFQLKSARTPRGLPASDPVFRPHPDPIGAPLANLKRGRGIGDWPAQPMGKQVG